MFVPSDSVELAYSESQKPLLFRIFYLGDCRNLQIFLHRWAVSQVMPPARGLPKSGSLHALGSVKRTCRDGPWAKSGEPMEGSKESTESTGSLSQNQLGSAAPQELFGFHPQGSWGRHGFDCRRGCTQYLHLPGAEMGWVVDTDIYDILMIYDIDIDTSIYIYI